MGEPQEYLADGTPLITAAYLGKLRLVRLLVEGGAQVNERNQRGETPLLAACRALRGAGEKGGGAGALRLLRFLLENKADPNAQDKAGRTALMYACMEKAGPAVAATLIGAGADPSMEDYAGASALVYAINARDQETLQVLLDACREKGRDIIIIATDLSTDGGSITRRYLNVPPSPDHSPVACMSPSEIELKTGSSPGSETETENIFDFRAAGRRVSAAEDGAMLELGQEGIRPHSQRLRSEPWLAIHNLAHLRSSYEEGLKQAAVREDEEEDCGEEEQLLLCDLNLRRRSSLLHPSSGGGGGGSEPSQGGKPGRMSQRLLLSPGGPFPHLGRRNTLPCLQQDPDVPLLQLPSLALSRSDSDCHLQAATAQGPQRQRLLSVSTHHSSWSLPSADCVPPINKRRGSQPKTSFLPPLPNCPTQPSPARSQASPTATEMPPRPPQAMPRLGGRWGRRLQRHHSVQLEQLRGEAYLARKDGIDFSSQHHSEEISTLNSNERIS